MGGLESSRFWGFGRSFEGFGGFGGFGEFWGVRKVLGFRGVFWRVLRVLEGFHRGFWSLGVIKGCFWEFFQISQGILSVLLAGF